MMAEDLDRPDEEYAPSFPLWDAFVDRVESAFGATRIADIARQRSHPNGRYIAETGRLYIGISWAGRELCVYVEPKMYQRGNRPVILAYRVARETRRGFNRLMGACPEITFSRNTHAGVVAVKRFN